MNKVLVTGSAGFIGYHLCKKLLDKKFIVYGIDNLNDYYSKKLKNKRNLELKKYKNFKFYKLDLKQKKIVKIFHYARFDLGVIKKYLGIMPSNVYCTKIASKIARTYSDKHGLRELCKELLGIEISKQQQSSYWGAKNLSKNQLKYAANDVLHLHQIKNELEIILEKEKRSHLINKTLKFLPFRVQLDLLGWENIDIFSHS